MASCVIDGKKKSNLNCEYRQELVTICHLRFIIKVLQKYCKYNSFLYQYPIFPKVRKSIKFLNIH